jgi:hypothetical protein
VPLNPLVATAELGQRIGIDHDRLGDHGLSVSFPSAFA